jgi:DNA repair protein radc
MNNYVSIKNWSEEDRPREKFIAKGAEALTNAELLAILINTGTQNKSAIDIAKELLTQSDNNLLELGKCTLFDLKKIKGMGEKKAITLIAALELGKRRQVCDAKKTNKINSSKEAFDVLQPFFVDLTHESFMVIYLNNNNHIQAIDTISEGGMTATLVDVRIVLRKALELKNVTKMIVAHNHPSGNLNPSEADKQLTKKLSDAAKIMDINLLDHIIVTQTSYYSFADEGLL